MLARLPLAPPEDLRVTAGPDAVTVSWVRSRSGGDVGYRVTRVHQVADGAEVTATIGRTAAPSFEAAGAPGGVVGAGMQ